MSTVMRRYAVRVVAVVLCIVMFTGCNRYQNIDTTTTQTESQTSTDPGTESNEPGSDLLPDQNEIGEEDEKGTIAEDEPTEAVSDEETLDDSDAATMPPTEEMTELSTEMETTEVDSELETTEDAKDTEEWGENSTEHLPLITEEYEETEPISMESETHRPTKETEGTFEAESSESVRETITEAVATEEEMTEAPETEEITPTEASTEASSETETEEVKGPVTQPASESVTEPKQEPETQGSTERETEAEIVLQSIQIKANQSQYTEGWKLTKANLTVLVYYSDGTTGTLSNGYTIHQTGDQVYVTYGGVKSNTITVVYEKTLASISIESKIDQYEQGYQIISANLNVTLHYSDGSTGVLTNGYSIHQTGTNVYVSYSGINSNTIVINYAAASSVTIMPKQESYLLGDVITLDDFVVTVHQIDGYSEVVTEGLVLLFQDQAVDSVVLQEYVNDVYMLYGYGFKVSYQGIVSEAVRIEVRYEEKPYLCYELLDLVNEARISAGLPVLRWDPEAEEEILIRAEELTKLYAHNRPNGEFISEMYSDFWGENIASGGFRSKTHAQTVFLAWMNSPGHQSLILDSFELATGFVCAYYIATDANGYQAAYTVMWVTTN